MKYCIITNFVTISNDNRTIMRNDKTIVICITNGKKVIGDCLYVSTEAKLTTIEQLGNNVMIAANSVVTKLCDEDVVLLLGMLASIKKKQDAWYSNNERYFSNIQKFEKLREIIYG